MAKVRMVKPGRTRVVDIYDIPFKTAAALEKAIPTSHYYQGSIRGGSKWGVIIPVKKR